MADGTALKEEREKKCVGEKERKINLEISLSLLWVSRNEEEKKGGTTTPHVYEQIIHREPWQSRAQIPGRTHSRTHS
jgi:hypothetical protein